MKMNKRDFREDIDRQMEHVVLTPERRRAILDKAAAGSRPTVRLGRMVLAAGLAGMLTLGAVVAAVPSLRQLLADALGSFESQSQTILDVADRDEGIEVRAVSALADGSYTKLYLEVQDLEEDRLEEKVMLGAKTLGWHIDLPMADRVSTWGQHFLGYDPDTKTALIELEVGGTVEEGTTAANLKINGLTVGNREIDAPLPQDILTAEIRETKTLPDGKTVLAPEQTPAALEGEKNLRLSSMGFGTDGALHVQVALGEGMQRESLSLLYTARSHGSEDDSIYNKEFADAQFEQDGIYYYDIAITGSTPADLPNLYVDAVYGQYNTSPAIQGEWELEIPIQRQQDVAYQPNAQVGLTKITQVTVSSMSISVVSENDSNFCFGTLEQSAKLRDGTVIKLNRENNILAYYSGVWDEGDVSHSFDQWMLPEPIDPADLASITLAGVEIKLG